MFKRIISSFFALIMALLPFGKEAPQKCEAKFNGTFIQSWYCLWWDDERWQQEVESMKKAGIEYLILQDTASFTDADNATLSYPSELECFAECEKYGDIIGDALRNCKGSGIKIFVGLADFEDWWTLAGLTSEYNKICDKMAQMVEEIYNKYYAGYEDTFYGWYFTPEINNVPTMKLSILNIAKGFNEIIDTADRLNPDMPMLLSPYYTEHLSIPSVVAALPEWQLFMQKAHLRDGDIFCPQDAVGAGWIDLKDLDKVWKMYTSVIKSCDKDIKLWANCESMTVARDFVPLMPPKTLEDVNMTATLDRFVQQMPVASKYVDNIITFSFNHYYCDDEVNPVYFETYLDYIKNGCTLETEKPSSTHRTSAENGVYTWEPASDNIGVAYYLIYRERKAVARIEATDELKFEADMKHEYSIVTVDGAGNKSDAIIF